jgi:hypothetical protein
LAPGSGSDDVTAPNGICVPRWVCEDPQWGAVGNPLIFDGVRSQNLCGHFQFLCGKDAADAHVGQSLL